MFNLIHPAKILSAAAVLYAAIWIILSSVYSIDDPFVVFRTAGIIELFFLILGGWGWRKLWCWIPYLNRWFFPDLNGQWKAKIDWVRDGKFGHADAQVFIKQSFFKIAIEVISPNSDSETLAVIAKRDTESGRPMLHYIYMVTPKQISPAASSAYHGAALLKVDLAKNNLLSGNYFTNRASSGHFLFERFSE